MSPIASEFGRARQRFAPSLWRHLARLLRSWWRSDRIRVSPREGELLRLQIGDVVVIHGVVTQVANRSVVGTAENAQVLYECAGAAGSQRLEIAVAPDGPTTTVSWKDCTDSCALMADDIEVYREA